MKRLSMLGILGLLLVLTTDSHQRQQRPPHKRRSQRHQNQHGEGACRQDSQVITDIQDDQLNQSARVHQRAQRERVTPAHSRPSGHQHTRAELARDGDDDYQPAHRPALPIIEQTDLQSQTREGKE